MNINKAIKTRRLELGLTLKEVAKALGIAESTISRYETNNIQNMGIDKIEALAKVLQCSPSYLMGWSDSIEPTIPHFTNVDDAKEYLKQRQIFAFNGKDTYSDNTILQIANTIYNDIHK